MFGAPSLASSRSPVMRRATALLALPLATLALAGLAGTVINGNGARRTITADGDVTVNGNRNRLTIKATTSTLRVAGNNNRVYVDRVATIDVPGNNNRIEWHVAPPGSPGGKPKITNLGNGNTIIHK